MGTTANPRDADFIDAQNSKQRDVLKEDYEALRAALRRRGIDIDVITQAVGQFAVAIPSWGVGTGGTRFARFPGPGEPPMSSKNSRTAQSSMRSPARRPASHCTCLGTRTDDLEGLKARAAELRLGFDAVNSNTFQDRPKQAVLQIRQPDAHRQGGARAGDRTQPRVHQDR